MIDPALLLKDLKAQLKLLKTDLLARAEDTSDEWGARLRQEWAAARRRERTGYPWIMWRDNEVDQAAVAWIIPTTFLRFCEDNDLLAGAQQDGRPVPVGWIAGPGDRTARAEENLTAYFRANPTDNRRHWLQQGFRVLAAQPAGKALVDPQHNPVWTAEISPESATALIDFWRRTDASGTLIHDFTDRDLGTRFLGDLYQDLSEHAKKTYALLQTPVFVEEFILDQTLTPALKEFGHDGLKLIDPTCGSGHFLLGAFDRLLAEWTAAAPAMNVNERVRRAMDSIHGVDLNPFAVAIARFRLTVAGLKAMGERSLVGVAPLNYHLAIGDALLGESGGVPAQLPFEEDDDAEKKATYLYDTEDLKEYSGILQPGQYHVVVGNPPYITVKDKALNRLYRSAYRTATGTYALSVPFVELLFRLAVHGSRETSAGFIGQITANSFMKRGFGKKVIEDLFAGFQIDNPVDLTAIVDTSGAHIPGHGTPTVILIGRRRRPVDDVVRAVLSTRGEPGVPDEPAKGLVWNEIVDHFDEPGFDGRYVSVADLARIGLNTHPWTLSGGNARGVFEEIGQAPGRLVDIRESIGRTTVVGADDAWIYPITRAERLRARGVMIRPFVTGEHVRDFEVASDEVVVNPYVDEANSEPVGVNDPIVRLLWPLRSTLSGRTVFEKTFGERGLPWWVHLESYSAKLRTPMSLTFAYVATHNHFALDRERRLFNRHAPVIKLPEGAGEAKHLELLGLLNSSAACFWLKQVSQDKGNRGGERSTAMDTWDHFYEFSGAKLEQFPIPAAMPLNRGRTLDMLARELDEKSPCAIVLSDVSELSGTLAQQLKEAETIIARLRERMIFEQEELDWAVYRLYGLLDDDLTYSGDALDQLALGQRAFEVALARKVEAGEEETAWFTRHGSTPITELPTGWPADYAALVQRRLDLIESDPNIRLLEKPEFKRRWVTTPWAEQLTAALKTAILDRLEQPELWRDEQGPAVQSVSELADQLRTDAVLRELAAVLTGNAEPDLAAVLNSLVTEEAVPYLAAHRYTATGLEKYRTWQEVWALQRREDAGERVEIDVPPKYNDKDFRRKEFWRARGKLDVPKERFVLYPGLRREGDPTPVLGWAGWDHRDQALALGRELPNQDALGAGDDALVPMVAGLVELEPWLHQWHHEVDPAFGISPAAAIGGLVDQYLQRLETTRERVTAWTPPAPTRGRRAKVNP